MQWARWRKNRFCGRDTLAASPAADDDKAEDGAEGEEDAPGSPALLRPRLRPPRVAFAGNVDDDEVEAALESIPLLVYKFLVVTGQLGCTPEQSCPA